MDCITPSQQRLAFVRVCIELDVAVEIPRNIEIVLRNGRTVMVSVTVPWMPLKCSVCNIFGHFVKDCANKPVAVTTKVWVPKKAMENETEEKKDPDRKEEGTKQMKDKGKKQWRQRKLIVFKANQDQIISLQYWMQL